MPSEPGGFVVRDHSAAAPPVARIVARARTARPSSSTTPAQRPSCIQALAARAPSSTAMRGSSTTSAESWRTTRRPVALPPACTTRRTRVAALEAEREDAAAVGVEAHAEPLEVVHARGRLADEHLRRPSGGRAPRPASLGVGEVAARRSPRPRARRRSRPAPSSSRSARAGWPRRARRAAPAAAARQRRVQAGGAGADDREVAAEHRFVGHPPGTVSGWPSPVLFRHPVVAGARHGRASGVRRGGSSRSSAR